MRTDLNGTYNDGDAVEMLDYSFRSPTTVPLNSETHSGADVGIFARGPFAHFFHGVHEQTFIYYVMAYSTCLDEFKDEPHCKVNNASASLKVTSLLIFVMIFAIINDIL